MNTSKIKKFILGTSLVGGLIFSGTALMRHGRDKNKDKSEDKTEIKSRYANDKYGNLELFDASRSKIKFALAFVEGFSPTAYQDKNGNGTWTVGHGLTILYNEDGGNKPVTKSSKCTLEESDAYKDRYLTYDILPDIINNITVPMDENTLIATCVFRYCVGHANFKKSTYLKKLNAGETGHDLARYLTGFRRQKGVLKRLYFFAALMSEEIFFSDLSDLRAEGCYDLDLSDIVLCDSKGKVITDAENMAIWDFSNVYNNLNRAQNFGKKRKFIKDIVPDYVWKDVFLDKSTYAGAKKTVSFNQATRMLKESKPPRSTSVQKTR